MILQLNPPIPLTTPRGPGLAHLVIDYGPEHHLLWTVIQDHGGEVWSWPNPSVRGTENVTMGRKINKAMNAKPPNPSLSHLRRMLRATIHAAGPDAAAVPILRRLIAQASPSRQRAAKRREI